MCTNHSSKLVEQLTADGIAESHPAIKRMFLVVRDQFYKTLKRRGSNCVQTTLLLDAAMLHFTLSSINNISLSIPTQYVESIYRPKYTP